MIEDKKIWAVIKNKYSGNPDSLLAQKIFAVAQDVRNLSDCENDRFYGNKILELTTRIEILENEVRVLRGEQPIWRAMA